SLARFNSTAPRFTEPFQRIPQSHLIQLYQTSSQCTALSSAPPQPDATDSQKTILDVFFPQAILILMVLLSDNSTVGNGMTIVQIQTFGAGVSTVSFSVCSVRRRRSRNLSTTSTPDTQVESIMVSSRATGMVLTTRILIPTNSSTLLVNQATLIVLTTATATSGLVSSSRATLDLADLKVLHRQQQFGLVRLLNKLPHQQATLQQLLKQLIQQQLIPEQHQLLCHDQRQRSSLNEDGDKPILLQMTSKLAQKSSQT
ncbi:unnamed protein product, partial [Oikopleura dioica]